jgi:hypothetical protein
MSLPVELEPLQQKGDAMLRLVVNDVSGHVQWSRMSSGTRLSAGWRLLPEALASA